MASRGRQLRLPTRAPRRKTVWANSDMTALQTLTSTGVSALNLLAELEASIGVNWIPGITVGPIILTYQMFASAEASPTVGQGHTVGLGITLTDDDAVNLPDPESDDADWMFRTVFEAVTPIDVPASFAYPSVPWDVTQKSMMVLRGQRKLLNNHQSLDLIVQSSSVNGVHDPSIYASARTLVRLP